MYTTYNLTENIDMDMIDFHEAIGTSFYMNFDIAMSFITCCIALLVVKISRVVLYTIDKDTESDTESDTDTDTDTESDEIISILLRKKARRCMHDLEDCVRDVLQTSNDGMRQCDIGVKLGIRGGYYNKENNKWYERDRVVAQVLRNMMEAGYVEKLQGVYRLAA